MFLTDNLGAQGPMLGQQAQEGSGVQSCLDTPPFDGGAAKMERRKVLALLPRLRALQCWPCCGQCLPGLWSSCLGWFFPSPRPGITLMAALHDFDRNVASLEQTNLVDYHENVSWERV